VRTTTRSTSPSTPTPRWTSARWWPNYDQKFFYCLEKTKFHQHQKYAQNFERKKSNFVLYLNQRFGRFILRGNFRMFSQKSKIKIS
jgi:hypothetical protein